MSVRLLNVPFVGFRSFTVTVDPWGNNATSAQAFKRVMSTRSSPDFSINLYGSPVVSSENDSRWKVTLSEAITADAGDLITCGTNTHFVCDASVSASTTFYVREHANNSSSVALSTSPQVIITDTDGLATTNATAYITASSVLITDVEDAIYAASDGIYFVPDADRQWRWTIAAQVTNNWSVTDY
jgi:hypothetical protein